MSEQTKNPTPRYFHIVNCNRDFTGPPKVRFTPYDFIAGTQVGLFKSTDAAEQEYLAKLVAEKIGITEISEKEFCEILKLPVPAAIEQKNDLAVEREAESTPPSPPTPVAALSIEDKPGVLVEQLEAAPAPVSSEPVDGVAAIEVGDVSATAAATAASAPGRRRQRQPKVE